MPLRPSASDVTETIKNAAQANGSIAQAQRAASGAPVKASRSSAISARPVSAIGAIVKTSTVAQRIGLAPATSSGSSVPAIGSVSAHTGAKTSITVSTINYDLYTFLTAGNNTFVVDSGSITADIFVLGGGGSGGISYAGGGGAGGISVTSDVVFPPGTYTVVVGAGGTGVTSGSGNTGGNSTVTVSGVSYIGYGGGGGGGYTTVGKNGGCGGGGSTTDRIQGVGGGVGSQGFNGAGCGYGSAGGGGGGMGSIGNTTNLNGGSGLAYTFSGSSVVYAGGGGGHADGQLAGSAGSGGGGAGGGKNGTNGLGGGGGGYESGNTSGKGGDGRVMIRIKK